VRALADYDRALGLEADYVPALTGKGLSYEKMGDLARARAAFLKALASQHRLAKVDVHRAAQETAAAQLAALDSGTPLPVIPNALSKAASVTAIPTPTVAVVTPTAGAHQGHRIALVIATRLIGMSSPCPIRSAMREQSPKPFVRSASRA
jgi:tetratricopeptide (TPR) repeat protein